MSKDDSVYVRHMLDLANGQLGIGRGYRCRLRMIDTSSQMPRTAAAK